MELYWQWFWELSLFFKLFILFVLSAVSVLIQYAYRFIRTGSHAGVTYGISPRRYIGNLESKARINGTVTLTVHELRRGGPNAVGIQMTHNPVGTVHVNVGETENNHIMTLSRVEAQRIASMIERAAAGYDKP